MCLRTALKPIALSCWRSHLSASSVGAVYSPSGQKPWSRLAMLNRILPFSVIRSFPSAPGAVPISRIPKYDPTESTVLPPESSSTDKSYKYGLSGDHKRACGMGRVSSVSAAPVTDPPPRATARTLSPVPPDVLTLIFKTPPVTDGVNTSEEMLADGTGCIQTVRQMPELPW